MACHRHGSHDGRRPGRLVPSRTLAVAAACVLVVLQGCGSDTEVPTDPGSSAGTAPDQDASFAVLATQRRAEAPGTGGVDGVQATVVVSAEDLDEQWPRWEPLGTDQPSVEGLGTERSMVLLWAPDHPVRVSSAGLDGDRVLIEGVREVPGDDCATSQEVTGWTTVVVLDAVPGEPGEPELDIAEETVDC